MQQFVVFNTKGGVGKTTVACGLMTAMRRAGYDATACDADPQGSLTAWFALEQRRGLAEVLSGTLGPSFAGIRAVTGTSIVPAGDRALLRQLASRPPAEIPPYAREIRAQLLVIDTAAGVNGLTDSFLRRRDTVVLVPIPLAGGYLPLAAVDQVEDHLLQRFGRLPDFLVPNMLDLRTSASETVMRQLRARYPDRLTPPIRINAALVHAAGAHLAPADQKSVEDFGQLARYLLDAVGL